MLLLVIITTMPPLNACSTDATAVVQADDFARVDHSFLKTPSPDDDDHLCKAAECPMTLWVFCTLSKRDGEAFEHFTRSAWKERLSHHGFLTRSTTNNSIAALPGNWERE